jgi:hypothetical protein
LDSSGKLIPRYGWIVGLLASLTPFLLFAAAVAWFGKDG